MGVIAHTHTRKKKERKKKKREKKKREKRWSIVTQRRWCKEERKKE
jgi:hypothetical protein